jgi:deoxyribonuclease-4
MPLDRPESWPDIASRLTHLAGGGRLGLIHANDCLFERGSRRDRHAWIGDGFIGEAAFAAMMNEPALADTAVCTELSGEKPQKDAINIARLKSYRQNAET